MNLKSYGFNKLIKKLAQHKPKNYFFCISDWFTKLVYRISYVWSESNSATLNAEMRSFLVRLSDKLSDTPFQKSRARNQGSYSECIENSTLDVGGRYHLMWQTNAFFNIFGRKQQDGLRSKCTNYKPTTNDKVVRFFVTP